MEIDKNLQKLLLKKDTPEPMEGFEEIIMANVYKTSRQNQRDLKYLYFSWFFFFLGLVIGIIVSAIGIDSDSYFLGIDFSKHKFVIQILCSVVMLLLFERIYKLTIDVKNDSQIR